MASNGKGAEIVRKFNKLYLMPDRKTRLQTSMDVVFGRKEVLRRVPRDYYWQIAVCWLNHGLFQIKKNSAKNCFAFNLAAKP